MKWTFDRFTKIRHDESSRIYYSYITPSGRKLYSSRERDREGLADNFNGADRAK